MASLPEMMHGAVPMDAGTREHCFALIRQLRDEPISMVFRQPVSRKKGPQYYEVITQPMDIKTLEARLAEGAYGTLEEFANAMRLIWRNAFVFNEKGDKHGLQVFEAAKQLALAAEESIEEIYAAHPATAADELPAMQRLALELFHMRNHTLAHWFRDPVSPELMPDYYETIEEPMDLRSAVSNIDLGHWTKPAQVQEGVHLIWTNARVYNGEGSAIDATALVCCITWNARYSRAVGSAPKQRKLRRVETASALDQLRITLLDLCRHLSAKALRQVVGVLAAHVEELSAEPCSLAADLSRANSEELLAGIAIARAYLEAHPLPGS
jgi:hypothetical protein